MSCLLGRRGVLLASFSFLEIWQECGQPVGQVCSDFPSTCYVIDDPVETPEVTSAFGLLSQMQRSATLFHDFLVDAVEDRFYLVKQDIQRYVNRLQETAAVSVVPQVETIMVEMLDRLNAWQRAWGIPLRAMRDNKVISGFTSTFSALLHSSLPSIFPAYLHSFLVKSLASLPSHLIDPPHNPHLLQSVPINLQKVSPPSPHLSKLGILPRYSATLSGAAYEEISKIAREEAGRGWETRRLTRARQRVGDGVANWLAGMFEGNEAAQTGLRPMFSRFDYYLCKCFFDIRTDELFDIIVAYPDSMAALEDLKECLFKVDQRSVLVDKLKTSTLKRLLHPGAETKVVIAGYISTIRCLRILDPAGVLLHKVADPIRKHLRERQDTIRCIVSTMVEGDELQDENESSAGLIPQVNDETVEDFSDPKWDPEPYDAAPEFRSGKASDIISTLVSIYESRDVIVKELQILLATRLLAVKDYDAVREIRTVELLKIRFGEQALQICDVMLKDMADSKRIDDHVHGDIESKVHPLVISRMFWPNIQPSSLHLTPKLESAQRAYEAAFHHFKPDKRLRWLQHIGTAVVKLELEDRVVEVEATPIQAAIAELFSEKSLWSLVELGQRLGVLEESTLRSALGFWVGLGVIKSEGERWTLLEVAEQGPVPVQTHVEDAPLPQKESADEMNANKVRIHWLYIKGVLTNLGPTSLDRIQGMLKYIDEYDQSIDDLEQFMTAARGEGMVDLRSDGKWVLREGG
ncbi:hypothetical protein TREMEDRAFT_45474 [Tremella mesenterica DSM 1558]|uniref:uncharacterized protein n=1 Tax=Tremella mesenterica (strain ATCC 24925 / CBS 8224 / DSM 1558 / NBRC 9311 / NRRL Y-6157 / RJB 2259-6 / UBC 559-6) TaxID=578456 RepID=UPI0003F49443|nr:uncharacterized protein TREMEDRAFT_45474 [Tremella mesenterica DSM 1558]EIW67008.1 hypothetical protein TREMEDRAFT_45474 [Tremella mesenterica DSM 1558]